MKSECADTGVAMSNKIAIRMSRKEALETGFITKEYNEMACELRTLLYEILEQWKRSNRIDMGDGFNIITNEALALVLEMVNRHIPEENQAELLKGYCDFLMRGR